MRIDIKNNVKIYLISIIIVAITIIGTIFNFEHTYQVTKQDYTEPVYGSGSLDGWSLQFDMYTNIEGEDKVDKTNSIENIIGKLNINEVYTLHELKAPNNYEIAEDMMFKITDNGQLMLYKNKDYEELDNNTMIVIDKEKIINPATKYPVYIEFFAIIIILSIGILALIPKKYSE